MGAVGANGTIVLSRPTSDVVAPADPTLAQITLAGAIPSDLRVEVQPQDDSGGGFYLALVDERPTATSAAVRAIIDRTGLRGGITRRYQRISRFGATTGIGQVYMGGLMYLPIGETCTLEITVVGTEVAEVI